MALGASARLWGSVGWQTEPWQPAPCAERVVPPCKPSSPQFYGPPLFLYLLEQEAALLRSRELLKVQAGQHLRHSARARPEKGKGPPTPNPSEQTAKATTVLELIPVPCTDARTASSSKRRMRQYARASPSLQKQLPSVAGEEPQPRL